MKVLGKVVAGICIAIACSGYAYKGYQGEQKLQAYRATLVQKTFEEKFRSGDTVDEILKQYHNEVNEGVNFQEFKFNTLHLKENAHLLNEKGGLKLIQVGEKMTIVARVKVQDEQ